MDQRTTAEGTAIAPVRQDRRVTGGGGGLGCETAPVHLTRLHRRHATAP